MSRIAIIAVTALVAQPLLAQPSDKQIRDRIIEESIARYSGSCPCPYNTDRGGRKCGGRSAWSRPGGKSPKCFPKDVTDAEVAAHRAVNH